MNEQLPPLPERSAKGYNTPPNNEPAYPEEWSAGYEQGFADARAALAMSPKKTSGTSLPPPDMTMPSIAQDGPEGAHYYRASTVRRLLENKGESA